MKECNPRDDFPEGVRRALRERVGGLCSRPECGRPTVAPNLQDTARVDITGRAAHITAASRRGPRFDETLTSDQRRGADNGIWLCSDCADLVDKNEGHGFSAAQLLSWKRHAEDRLANAHRLGARLRRPTWLDTLGTPHYVNLPRLLHLVGHDAISPRTSAALANGFPREGLIVRELSEVENALRRMTVEAVDVQEIEDPPTQLVVGLMISYSQNCRTKNGANTDAMAVQNYSFDRSPLIYLTSHGIKYVQPYDPIWLTTNTAIGTVRSGSCTLSGIAIIKSIDLASSQVIASPLTFGVPDFF